MSLREKITLATSRRVFNALFASALVVLLLATGTRQSAQSRPPLHEEFHQTYPLASGRRVSLENINGAVRISTWERNEVKVDAVKSAYKQERLAEAEIRVESSADSLRVKTKYPQSNLTFNRDGREREDNPATVEYTLTVPRGARLDSITLVNGALDIEGVAGEINASSVNGTLTARSLSGRAKLAVVNGSLEAVFNQLDATSNIELTSVNGPVTLTIPSDANAEVRANTVHGGISNDFGLPVRRGRYIGQDLSGRLGGGGALIKLSNVNGSLKIRHASDGRGLSPATNLLSEARKDDADDADNDSSDDNDDEREDAREAVREAGRAAREAAQAAREATKNLGRDGEDTDAEAARDARESQREVARAQRDAQRAARQAEREAVRAVAEATRGLDIAGENFGAREHQQESKSFPVSGAARLRVETFDGRITVRAWDKPEIMFTALKRAADEREMRGINLRSEQQGGEVTLVAEFDKSFARDVRREGKRVVSYNSNASVNYEVFVPRNAVVRASTGDGNLRIEGVKGELDVHTGDGSIDVSGAGGQLKAETGDGHIRIVDFDGAADTRTGDGRITLDGRFTSLAARTGDGSISLALPNDANATVETDAETVVNDGLAVAEDGDAAKRVRHWRIGRGGNVMTLKTGDGQIVLRQR